MPPHLVQKGKPAQHWDADSSRIRRELRYREPVPVEDAIARTIAWERATPMGAFNPHRFDYAAEDAAHQNGGMMAAIPHRAATKGSGHSSSTN